MTKPYTTPSHKELRHYGFIMAAAFFVLSLLATGIGYWLHGEIRWTRIAIFNGIGIVIFLIPALVAPGILAPIHKYWMKFAAGLGWVNQRIVLSLVWYLVFSPVSFVQRIIGRDPMQRKLSSEATTYWIDRSKEETKLKHFERQF